MTNRIFLTVAAFVQLLLFFPVSANAAEFIPLGPGRGVGVSDDGRVVTLGSAIWTETTDWMTSKLDPLPGSDLASAGWGNTVSTDGRVIVGVSRTGEPDYFREATIWRDGRAIGLGNVDSEAAAVTPDGQVVVGLAEIDGKRRAFRWTEEDGMVGLDVPTRTGAEDVSHDGRVIIGRTSVEPFPAFRWTPEQGMVDLGFYPGGYPFRVSGDGQTIVGYNVTYPTPNDPSVEAFRWTESEGLVPLGWLPDVVNAETRVLSGATGVNADGSIIVGASGDGGEYPRKAFIWSQQYGLEDFRQALMDRHGLSDHLEGWRLATPLDISSNGQFIVGQTRSYTDGVEDVPQAWLIRLDRPFVIPGDYSPDGLINVEDIDLQAAAMTDASPNLSLYDENDDGIVDLLDRSIWITEHAQTWAGDANLDQDVDFADFLSLSSGFGQAGGWAQGDFDGNGMVAFEDFLMLSDSFGNSVAPGQAAVPEPSAFGLAALGMLAVVSTRRKRRSASTQLIVRVPVHDYARRGTQFTKLTTFTLLSIALQCFVCPHTHAETFGEAENQFEIEFVTIGDLGNPEDDTGYPNPAGSVDYRFSMGKHEVSRELINRANASGGLEISLDPMDVVFDGPRPNMPATGVTWNEAARFVNWLNTSQGLPPAYRFDHQPGEQDYDPTAGIHLWPSGEASEGAFRNPAAQYFLPTVHEWYKAAYYDPNKNGTGGYWNFPNGSDSPPLPVANGTEANTAVYDYLLGDGPADVTLAGGLSPYGVMGLAGNVYEWQETTWEIEPQNPAAWRIIRGGNWDQEFDDDHPWEFDAIAGANWWSHDVQEYWLGFRVVSVPTAAVPEPNSNTIMSIGLLCAVFARFRSARRR